MRSLMIWALAISVSSPAFAQWKLLTKKYGIKVYRRASNSSQFHIFRAVGVVKAPPSRVFTIVQDIKKMPRWVEGAHNVRLIKKNFNAKSYNLKINQYYQIFYAMAKVPWPFENRDYILKGTVGYRQKQKASRIKLTNVRHRKYPPKKGLTRMRIMRINMSIKAVNKGAHALVDFTVHADPGGNLPPWIVNYMAKNEPLKSLRKLRRLASSGNYDKETEKLVKHHMFH